MRPGKGWSRRAFVQNIGYASALAGFSAQAAVPAPTPSVPPPRIASPASTNDVAVIKTSAGDLVVEFWPEVAPKTVENFKKLARQGFYDGTASHRLIAGFMIQMGDPLTKDPAAADRWGSGGPGYSIPACAMMAP